MSHNIQSRTLSDLSEEMREALEEQYVDVTWPIMERFKKDLGSAMPESALDSAIDLAKDVPEKFKAYMKPAFTNPAIFGPFSKMLDVALTHRRETYTEDNTPSEVEGLLDYAVRVRILARNAKFSAGEVLADVVSNEEFVSHEKAYEEANEILLSCLLQKVDKGKVDDYVRVAGHKLASYGLNNLREHRDFAKFKKEAIEFKHMVRVHHKPMDLSISG